MVHINAAATKHQAHEFGLAWSAPRECVKLHSAPLIELMRRPLRPACLNVPFVHCAPRWPAAPGRALVELAGLEEIWTRTPHPVWTSCGPSGRLEALSPAVAAPTGPDARHRAPSQYAPVAIETLARRFCTRRLLKLGQKWPAAGPVRVKGGDELAGRPVVSATRGCGRGRRKCARPAARRSQQLLTQIRERANRAGLVFVHIVCPSARIVGRPAGQGKRPACAPDRLAPGGGPVGRPVCCVCHETRPIGSSRRHARALPLPSFTSA